MHGAPSLSLSRRKLLAIGIGVGAVITCSGGVWYLCSRYAAAPALLVTPPPLPLLAPPFSHTLAIRSLSSQSHGRQTAHASPQPVMTIRLRSGMSLPERN